MSSRIVLAWIAFAAMCGYAAGCGNDSTAINGGDGGHLTDATADGQGDDGAVFPGDDSGAIGTTDASLTPTVFGGGNGGTPGSCLGLGAGCTTGADCCSGDCTGGACTYPACTSDHGACTSNGNCCSQSCVSGTCAPLNTTCKTLGNQCTKGADCCSNLCSGGTCQASSFCGQGGDSCASAADCCTQMCTKAAGATLGTCGASPPSGPANCGVVDGQTLRRLGRRRRHRPQRLRTARVRRPVLQPLVRSVGSDRRARLPARERMPRRRRPLHAGRRLLRLGGPARRLRKARHVRHHGARDHRRVPQPDGLQARRRRVQAQDDVVQLVVRLLQRQLREPGHLQAGQHGRPALRGRPVRRRRRSVRVERQLLQRHAVRPEPRGRRDAAVRVLRHRMHLGVRRLHRQRRLLRRHVVRRRAGQHPRHLRPVRRQHRQRRRSGRTGQRRGRHGRQSRRRRRHRRLSGRRRLRSDLRPLRSALHHRGAVLQRRALRRSLRVSGAALRGPHGAPARRGTGTGEASPRCSPRSRFARAHGLASQS